MNSKKKVAPLHSDAKDAAIVAAARTDPDNPPLTEEQLMQGIHAREVPEKVARLQAKARVRGPQKAPLKRDVHIKLDADIVEHFKRDGRGWQTRLNATLRKAINLPKTG